MLSFQAFNLIAAEKRWIFEKTCAMLMFTHGCVCVVCVKSIKSRTTSNVYKNKYPKLLQFE